MRSLVCPRTGEVCASAEFCGMRKDYEDAVRETGWRLLDDVLGRKVLPAEVVDALDEAGFCADSRIEALEDLAEQSGHDYRLETTAATLAERMAQAREEFVPPDPSAPINGVIVVRQLEV